MTPEEWKTLTPEAKASLSELYPEDERISSVKAAPNSQDQFPKRKSAWANFLRVVAAFPLVAGMVGCGLVLSEEGSRSTAVIIAASGLGASIQFLFLAFVVDVFTDIRWYISRLPQAK